MPIPAVPRENILQALEEFDRSVRGTGAFEGWEQKAHQRYAIEHSGKRYPPKKIISMATQTSVSGFSGGGESNDYLTSRGFSLVQLRAREIADLLGGLVTRYPSARQSEQFGSQSPIASEFRRLEDALGHSDLLDEFPLIKVKASYGQGNWAKVPWIAFMDERETQTTQRGIYVVLLFRQDGSGCYVTLNQGVTEPVQRLGTTAGLAELRSVAKNIRGNPSSSFLQEEGFLLDDSIDLRADSGLGTNYEASTIAHKFYEASAVPNDEQIVTDLGALMRAYNAYVSEKAPALVEDSSIHLLLKWNSDREPRTVEIHKEIADRSGSVWWGKFGASGIGSNKLDQVQAQLLNGEPTCVFLSGGGRLWKTQLNAITKDAGEVDHSLIPSYYPKDQCSFFVRLSDFAPIERDWLLQNTVSDSNPQPGSTRTALQAQANPAYLRLVKPASRPICLIGTSKGIEDYVGAAIAIINRVGAWATWWSFPIKEPAVGQLQAPFYLYINVGSGQLSYRFKVDSYETTRGDEGIVSPWPESTFDEDVGKTRAGSSRAEVFKTWLHVVEIAKLDTPIDSRQLTPVRGLSTRENLLNPMTFGYAYMPDQMQSSADPFEVLVARTSLSREVLKEMVAAIRDGSPQIVLAGPPGTSKTWVALALADHISETKERVRLVQFHPNYSYEAFVEGLRPVIEKGGIAFKLEPGVLLQAVEDMRDANEDGAGSPLHVIVIDEMNRANLSRVFGELMYLFEYREKEIRLQYTEVFSLPANLRFIGTMNTADRSIRSIDIALRRRFDVFELSPDPQILERYFQKRSLRVPNLIEGFAQLNADLTEKLDRHHTIGHAFFMRDNLDRRALEAIWSRKVRPLVEEYFFDQPDIAGSFTLDKYWPASAQ